VPGFGDPIVYTAPLDAMGISYETLPPEPGGLRDQLDRAILALMAGQSGPEESRIAAQAVDTLRTRNVDGIILGCTEIPLLLGAAADAPDLLNPLQLLAEAAVRHALD
jgi:aspartate racemase